jgi:hypothetical protein
VAVRPTDPFTVSLAWSRVEYSQHDRTFDSMFPQTAHWAEAWRETVTFDDADEVHLGIEHVLFWGEFPVALRAGVWYDPGRGLSTATGDTVTFDEDWRNERTEAIKVDDSEMHYSAGFGVVFDNFQIDAAADYSDTSTTFSLSGVYRF